MLGGGAEEGVRWDESLEEVISGNCHLPALIIHWEIAFSLVLQKYNNSNKHLPKEQQLGFTKHTLPGASGCWLRPERAWYASTVFWEVAPGLPIRVWL